MRSGERKIERNWRSSEFWERKEANRLTRPSHLLMTQDTSWSWKRYLLSSLFASRFQCYFSFSIKLTWCFLFLSFCSLKIMRYFLPLTFPLSDYMLFLVFSPALSQILLSPIKGYLPRAVAIAFFLSLELPPVPDATTLLEHNFLLFDVLFLLSYPLSIFHPLSPYLFLLNTISLSLLLFPIYFLWSLTISLVYLAINALSSQNFLWAHWAFIYFRFHLSSFSFIAFSLSNSYTVSLFLYLFSSIIFLLCFFLSLLLLCISLFPSQTLLPYSHFCRYSFLFLPPGID